MQLSFFVIAIVFSYTVRFRHGRFVPERSGREVDSAARRDEVLALLDNAENGLTRREIHARLDPGVSARQVRRVLEELRDRELVVSTNRGPLTRWIRGQGAR